MNRQQKEMLEEVAEDLDAQGWEPHGSPTKWSHMEYDTVQGLRRSRWLDPEQDRELQTLHWRLMNMRRERGGRR